MNLSEFELSLQTLENDLGQADAVYFSYHNNELKCDDLVYKLNGSIAEHNGTSVDYKTLINTITAVCASKHIQNFGFWDNMTHKIQNPAFNTILAVEANKANIHLQKLDNIEDINKKCESLRLRGDKNNSFNVHDDYVSIKEGDASTDISNGRIDILTPGNVSVYTDMAKIVL